MKILVTGATGTVGSQLVNLMDGQDIVIGSRDKDLKVHGAKTVYLDYEKPDSYGDAMKGIDSMFLLMPSSPDMARISLEIGKRAKKAGVKRIVRLSAMGAAPDAITILRWHHDAERSIELSGVPYVHLRPSFFMQNLVNYSGDSIRQTSTFYSATGDGKMGAIDARDIALAAAKALQGGHDGKTYVLTGNEALSYGDMARILSRQLGRKVEHIPLPESEFRASLEGMSMPQWQVDSTVELYRMVRDGHGGMVTHHYKKITGLEPTSFQKFAEDYKVEFG